jgi:hypothetical protein
VQQAFELGLEGRVGLAASYSAVSSSMAAMSDSGM